VSATIQPASLNRPAEPTSEQCTSNARVTFVSGGQARVGMACWYPQMGGYVGKCVVVGENDPGEERGCFEAWVWHDGEFPFAEDDSPREPARLHHCATAQFAYFAEQVDQFMARAK
jgi:hypothetical protein